MQPTESESLLVFVAKLVSDYEGDADRVFALHYDLGKKKISIFEKRDDKKGIPGGRFLAPIEATNPATGKPYEDTAFYVGARIQVAARTFELVDAPEYTLCHLEANAGVFTLADLQNAVDALKTVGKDTVRAAFEAKDRRRKTGSISTEDAKTVLFNFVPAITKQSAITIHRRFTNGLLFNYAELVGYL
jgi:hypothetical protein